MNSQFLTTTASANSPGNFYLIVRCDCLNQYALRVLAYLVIDFERFNLRIPFREKEFQNIPGLGIIKDEFILWNVAQQLQF